MPKATGKTPNRLDRYRAVMSALDGAKPAGSYYVSPPGAVSQRVTGRLLLQPGCSLAVLGGIGSGKTSAMLASKRDLGEHPDWFATYVDVAMRHDLSEIKPGTVLAAIGLTLLDQLKASEDEEVKKAKASFRRWSRGYSFDPGDPSDYYDDGLAWAPGLLKPPERPFYGNIDEMIAALRVLLASLASNAEHCVIFVDSLDRIASTADFGAACEQDIRALGRIAAVVVSAPLRLLFSADRHVLDTFSDFFHQSASNPSTSTGLDFLKQVVLARIGADIVTAQSAEALARKSGGALRDLVVLSRGAAELAYLDGGDMIERHHVTASADAFGRKLLLGITESESERLKRLARSGSFVSISDEDVGLLVSRRILEYQNGRTKYEVHPTIRPLLQEGS
jgi:hypothetical protein